MSWRIGREPKGDQVTTKEDAPRPVKRRSRAFEVGAGRLLMGMLCLFSLASQLNAQATSREEEIRQARTDKRARLWPERTSGIVRLLDKYTAVSYTHLTLPTSDLV